MAQTGITAKLDQRFKITERGSSFKKEIIAGITTFVAIAYILAVNPSILQNAGMDAGAVFTATALTSIFGTVLIGLFTNAPFLLCPSMGMNAYITYTVVVGMGYDFSVAMAAMVIEGILFLIISLTNLRNLIINAIPANLKLGVSVGIGLFITIIGLANAGILVSNDSTIVAIVSWTQCVADGTFNTQGISSILALLGVVLMAILTIRGVKGNILVGIVIIWIVGIICEICGIYVPDGISYSSLIPDFTGGLAVPSLAPIALHLNFTGAAPVAFVTVVIAILFSSVFDTLGTLIGASNKAGLVDEKGNPENLKGALVAESLTTVFAALVGTSPTCVCVECTAGIAEGGRTGFAALTTAAMFVLALFLSPLFLAIPSFATAPALILVGFLMMGAVTSIDFSDFTEAIPAFLCMIAMPFFYSITEGIALGIISYCLINAFTGHIKKINWFMWVLCVVFVLKYILI